MSTFHLSPFEGTLIDEMGNAVNQKRIVLHLVGTDHLYKITSQDEKTDALGRYKTEPVPPGMYEIYTYPYEEIPFSSLDLIDLKNDGAHVGTKSHISPNTMMFGAKSIYAEGSDLVVVIANDDGDNLIPLADASSQNSFFDFSVIFTNADASFTKRTDNATVVHWKNLKAVKATSDSSGSEYKITITGEAAKFTEIGSVAEPCTQNIAEHFLVVQEVFIGYDAAHHDCIKAGDPIEPTGDIVLSSGAVKFDNPGNPYKGEIKTAGNQTTVTHYGSAGDSIALKVGADSATAAARLSASSSAVTIHEQLALEKATVATTSDMIVESAKTDATIAFKDNNGSRTLASFANAGSVIGSSADVKGSVLTLGGEIETGIPAWKQSVNVAGESSEMNSYLNNVALKFQSHTGNSAAPHSFSIQDKTGATRLNLNMQNSSAAMAVDADVSLYVGRTLTTDSVMSGAGRALSIASGADLTVSPSGEMKISLNDNTPLTIDNGIAEGATGHHKVFQAQVDTNGNEEVQISSLTVASDITIKEYDEEGGVTRSETVATTKYVDDSLRTRQYVFNGFKETSNTNLLSNLVIVEEPAEVTAVHATLVLGGIATPVTMNIDRYAQVIGSGETTVTGTATADVEDLEPLIDSLEITGQSYKKVTGTDLDAILNDTVPLAKGDILQVSVDPASLVTTTAKESIIEGLVVALDVTAAEEA